MNFLSSHDLFHFLVCSFSLLYCWAARNGNISNSCNRICDIILHLLPLCLTENVSLHTMEQTWQVILPPAIIEKQKWLEWRQH